MQCLCSTPIRLDHIFFLILFWCIPHHPSLLSALASNTTQSTVVGLLKPTEPTNGSRQNYLDNCIPLGGAQPRSEGSGPVGAQIPYHGPVEFWDVTCTLKFSMQVRLKLPSPLSHAIAPMLGYLHFLAIFSYIFCIQNSISGSDSGETQKANK